MKLTFKIAKNELRYLFYSPVAWFLLILFLVMCAYYYTGFTYGRIRFLKDTITIPSASDLALPASYTSIIFTGRDNGMLILVLQNLYLFIPLLTMAVINREFNGGSFKLLYASPVKPWQIVLGKYLGLMLFSLFFILILGIFMVTGAMDIKPAIDYGPLISSGFGIYMALCAFTAIGLFTSSVTRYPIVAAIASFTLLFILSNIGKLWQEYNFIRDLTYFLSINNRTTKMIVGLVSTKDVIYFLVIIYMFLGFTLLKLKMGLASKPWYMNLAGYLMVIVSGMAIGYLFSRPGVIRYVDVTARKTNTLHLNTQTILKELNKGPLEVTLYSNLFTEEINNNQPFLPKDINPFLDKWEPYLRFKNNIRFKYVYYYAFPPGDSSIYQTYPGKTLKQIAGLKAKILQADSAMFIPPGEIAKMVNLNAIQYTIGIRLKYGDSTFYINSSPGDLYNDQQDNQLQFNAAFKRMLGTKMPRLSFITGALQRSILKRGEREYSWMASFYNDGFDLDTLNLETEDISTDITTLTLADPIQDLKPLAAGKIQKYIARGGNMFILGEPGKQSVLNPVLQQLGLQLIPGQLVQPSPNETADKIMYNGTTAFYFLSKEPAFVSNQHYLGLKYNQQVYNNNQLISDDSTGNSFPMTAGATTILYTSDSGFAMRPLLKTIPGRTWLTNGKLVLDSTAPVFSPQKGDIRESTFPVMVQLTRNLNGREQRIVVAGDADLASNLRQNPNIPVRSIYSWLNYNLFPVYTPRPFVKDNWLAVTRRWAKTERLLYVWILPGLLLVLGSVVLIRRKRR